MDLKGLIQSMQNTGILFRVVNDPRAQFGPPARSYLGASVLPEKAVSANEFKEESIQYRTVVANAGTRYSPAQKKGGAISGSMLVTLGNSDIASELTGADYDALLALIDRATQVAGTMGGGNHPNFAALAQGAIFNWVDLTLNRPLLEHNEKNRWQAIVDAQVSLTGDNGYAETVYYPNPSGHRVAAGGDWDDDSYDPYDDIMAMVEMLAAKGYTVARIITSTPVVAKLATNDKMKARFGRIKVASDNTLENQPAGRITLAMLNQLFSEDGLPPIEKYDLQYRTQSTTARFLVDDAFVMLANTGRDQSIDRGDLEPVSQPSIRMPNTVGYMAVGRPAGQPSPGRKVFVDIKENKPPRIEGESWQTSLPVITDPEAIAVITNVGGNS